MPLCAKPCRTRQNRRDTTADDLKNQPRSHHRQLLGHPDCCCRARRSPPAPRFPHRLHPAPRGFLLGRFSNAGRYRSQPEPPRRGPHRKTFTDVAFPLNDHRGPDRVRKWTLECANIVMDRAGLAQGESFPPLATQGGPIVTQLGWD
jgi:hypothetical protein